MVWWCGVVVWCGGNCGVLVCCWWWWCAFAGKPQPRSGQKSIIRPSLHSDSASLLSVSVATSSSSSASPCRRFVTMVAVSETTSSFSSASPCRRFVRIVTVTMSCLTMSCFFAASRDAWWQSAGVRILQLRQKTNDLVEARVVCHYFDIQSWLPSESHGNYHRLFEFHSL